MSETITRPSLEAELRSLSRVDVPTSLADAVMADVALTRRGLWMRLAIGTASFGAWAAVMQQAVAWTASHL